MGVRHPLSLIALACLLAAASAFPLDAESTDSSDSTGFKPWPLAKTNVTDVTFPDSPPGYTLVPIEEITANFGGVEFLPAERPKEEARDVIGTDDRTAVDSTAFPYAAVGRVLWSDGSWCTGSLVADKVVLTASHCVPWNQQSSISLVFQPGYNSGERFGRANVIEVSAYLQQTAEKFDSSACGLNSDFAILHLDTGLASKVGGTFAVQSWNDGLANSASFNHIGYPQSLANGEKPYQQKPFTATIGSSLKCNGTGPISTQADTSTGQSGGPLYTISGNTLTGVFSAANTQQSIFASGSLVELVNWARSKWA